MNNILLIGVAMLICVSISFAIFRVGHRQMKKMESNIEKAIKRVQDQYKDIEIIGPVIYQGGLVQFPRAGMLHLGLTGEELVLYTEQGFLSGSYFRDWLHVDKFTVLQKADTHGKSMTMLGPFASILYQDKKRYFITIQYMDIDREENHMVFELKDKTYQRQIYDKLSEYYWRFIEAKTDKADRAATLHRSKYGLPETISHASL